MGFLNFLKSLSFHIKCKKNEESFSINVLCSNDIVFLYVYQDNYHMVKVWVSPVEVIRNKGRHTVFFCEVDYIGHYDIQWSFYGLPLPSNAKSRYNMELDIDDITYENEGHYVCLVQSRDKNYASAHGHLIVNSGLKNKVGYNDSSYENDGFI